ncbi:C-terminal-binding protein 1 [Aspergillus affinis]|uniref:C-terminal-binding protein 1 n=1 Tax=Aspergillus affinis TaxID=1070780 RepID=UPI0022FE9D12|nr:C-terminal-binding protein 1 [Aspergillus affinis]KAI9044080.1 C-terminal-binding protein 1 [Aspergillus affinis]
MSELSNSEELLIVQADGLYPDDAVEQQILKDARIPQSRKIKYLQLDLFPTGTATPKPWTTIPEELRREVDGILTLKMYFTAEDLQLFPKLKVIVRMGVGYDRLDRVALAQRNVTVCNVPDYGTAEIADHALGLALSLRRGILLHHDLQREPYVEPWMVVDTPLVARIRDTTYGVLGLGRIGTAAALRAKAFGWRVIFYDPYVPNGYDKTLDIERVTDIRELFRRSTTLSIHCACTHETREMIGSELVSLMPCGSVLVNTARGEVLQLDAVEEALRRGVLAGAGLDVLPEEPIPEDRVHSLIRAYRRNEDWLDEEYGDYAGCVGFGIGE